MALVLEGFPVLTDKMFRDIEYSKGIYRYTYSNNGIECELIGKPSDGSGMMISLTDPKSLWHPETHNLNITIDGRIKKRNLLFGVNGIVAKAKGVIGVAVIWSLKDSNRRGVVPIGEFSYNDFVPEYVFKETINFGTKILRGTLILRICLYLKEVGVRQLGSREMRFANDIGTILGCLDITKIIIDGSGSVFPIVEKSSSDKPLWWVDCNWVEADNEPFDENTFCLYINNSSKDYVELKINEGIGKSPLLREIVATALFILISKVVSKHRDDALNGTNYQQGSVLALVHYYIKVFEIGPSDLEPEKLAAVIKKKLEEKFR